jgi:hypothetical protein
LVSELIEETQVSAAIDANVRGLELIVPEVEPGLAIDADRQILAAAVANLLQNAFKFECAISRVGAVCSRLIFQNRHRPSNRTLLSATESNTRIKTGLPRIRSLCRPRSSTQSRHWKA